MEPQTPNDNQPVFQPQQTHTTPESYPSSTPPPERKLSPKVIGIIAAVIIIGLAVFFTIMQQSKQSDSGKSNEQLSTGDSSLYHGRAGYDPNVYQPKIGDPMALKWSSLNKPFAASADKKIVPACNILTLQNLQDKKVYVSSSSTPGSIFRTYLDGVGAAKLTTEDAVLPSSSDANECTYLLEEGDSMVILDVYQPPLVAESLVQHEIGRGYTASSDIGSVKVYAYSKDRANEHTYLLKSNDVTVKVKLRLSKSDAQRQDLLQTAAKNLTDLQSSAQGWAKTEYDTPTFKKSIALACPLVNNDDMVKLTGAAASQFARESIATGTAIVQLPSGKGVNYIQNDCIRENSGRGSSIGSTGTNFDQSLDITTSSYQSDEGAKFQMSDVSSHSKEVQQISGTGDEAFTFKDSAGNYTTLLRKGRFVVQLVLDRTDQDRVGITDSASNTAKLKTVATAIAGRLQSQQ